jgi:hypothetical protein
VSHGTRNAEPWNPWNPGTQPLEPWNLGTLEPPPPRWRRVCNRSPNVADITEELLAPADAAASGERRQRGPDRRKTIVDVLYGRLTDGRESFWATVHPLFMSREISRDQVQEIIRRGLTEARGNYRIVVRLFNMPPGDYKRFLNFLRKHDCQLPFRDYR